MNRRVARCRGTQRQHVVRSRDAIAQLKLKSSPPHSASTAARGVRSATRSASADQPLPPASAGWPQAPAPPVHDAPQFQPASTGLLQGFSSRPLPSRRCGCHADGGTPQSACLRFTSPLKPAQIRPPPFTSSTRTISRLPHAPPRTNTSPEYSPRGSTRAASEKSNRQAEPGRARRASDLRPSTFNLRPSGGAWTKTTQCVTGERPRIITRGPPARGHPNPRCTTQTPDLAGRT